MFQLQNSFTTWVILYDVDRPWDTSVAFDRALESIPPHVYYMSLLGLDEALPRIINSKQPKGTMTFAQPSRSTSAVFMRINAPGRRYSNALQAASFKGHDQVVRILLEKGADVNAHGGYYGNALQAASFHGHGQVVQMVLKKGAHINTNQGYFGTALHAASYGGHNQVVQILLEKRADVNAQDKDGISALHLAAEEGHTDILDSLITYGAKTTLCDTQMRSVLHHSINGQTCGKAMETVRWLLAHQIYSEDADVDNMTPLHLAVKSNRDDIAGLLLQHGCSVDIGVKRKVWLRCGLDSYYLEDAAYEDGRQDVSGLTPLHAAALFGSPTMVGFLLDHGADPNASDRKYGTPLHLALKEFIGTPEILDAWSESRNYVESSLDDLTEDPSIDNTDIYNYVIKMREEIINILLGCESIDIRTTNEDGQTLLYELRYGKQETSNKVKWILAKGADINAKNNKGETPFYLAA